MLRIALVDYWASKLLPLPGSMQLHHLRIAAATVSHEATPAWGGWSCRPRAEPGTLLVPGVHINTTSSFLLVLLVVSGFLSMHQGIQKWVTCSCFNRNLVLNLWSNSTHTVASAQRGPVPGNPDFQDPSWAAGDGRGAGKMNMKNDHQSINQ